jgi:hypothetical protein
MTPKEAHEAAIWGALTAAREAIAARSNFEYRRACTRFLELADAANLGLRALVAENTRLRSGLKVAITSLRRDGEEVLPTELEKLLPPGDQ